MGAPVGGTPATPPPVDVGTYVLGAEDVIAVSMWEEPNFSGSFTIRPDGMISMPLIGEIKAAGKTPLQLQDDVNKAALQWVKVPRSTINLLSSQSKHIYFDGEGIGAGALPLVMPIHLLEAISARGGLKDFADSKHIRILRDQKLFLVVNYKDLLTGKHPEKNILLQDNDHVVVK
jgi:polysaccharide export outer membrane protein